MRKKILYFILAGFSLYANAQEIDTTLWATDSPASVIARLGNTIYIGGDFTQVGPNLGHGLSVDKNTGSSIVRTFPYVNGAISHYITDGKGGWYITGDFTYVANIPRKGIAHILPGYTLDLAWNPDIFDHLYTFGEDLNNFSTYDITYSENNLYLVGNYTFPGSSITLIKINISSGKTDIWRTESQVRDEVQFTIAVKGDTLFMGGKYRRNANDVSNCNYDCSSNLTAYIMSTRQVLDWTPAISGQVRKIIISGNKMYVTGNVTHTGSINDNFYKNKVFQINLSDLSVSSLDLQGTVFPDEPLDMKLKGDTLFIAGRSLYPYTGSPKLVWIDLTIKKIQIPLIDIADYSNISAIEIYDETIYFRGFFSTVNGKKRNEKAAFHLRNGLTDWEPALSNVSAFAVTQKEVLISGYFLTLGEKRTGLAALDANTGKLLEWNPNINNGLGSVNVSTILPSKLGDIIYVIGDFTSVDGQTRNKTAAFDTQTGKLTDFNANQTFYSLTVNSFIRENYLYYFNGKVNKMNLTSGTSQTWEMNNNSTLLGMKASGDTLFIWGYFSEIDGQSRKNFASYKISDQKLLSWQIPPDKVPVIDSQQPGAALSVVIKDSIVYIAGNNRIEGFNKTTGKPTGWLYELKDRQFIQVEVGDNKVYVHSKEDYFNYHVLPHLTVLSSKDASVLKDWTLDAEVNINNIYSFDKILYLTGNFSFNGIHKELSIAALGKENYQAVIPKKPNQIRGNVYIDKNDNCLFDVDELPVPKAVIKVTPGDYYGFPNEKGEYVVLVDTGNFTVTQTLPLNKQILWEQTCPTNTYQVSFNTIGNEINGKNFADKSKPAPNLITGTLWLNSYGTCQKLDNSKPFANVLVTLQPDNLQTRTDSLGYFHFSVAHTGTVVIKPNIPILQEKYFVASCDSTFQFTFPDLGNNAKKDFFFQSKPYYNFVKGNVYTDGNKNCLKEPGEIGIENITVIAQPGNYYTQTDNFGNYTLQIPDTGTFTIREQIPPVNKFKIIRQVCPTDGYQVTFKKWKETILEKNFGNDAVFCSELKVQVSSSGRRRCFTNTTNIAYQSIGQQPTPNVKIVVNMSDYVKPIKSSHPFTKDREGNLIFEIGTLNGNSSGSIQITDSVSCVNNITGLTVCTKAQIFPVLTLCNSSIDYDNSDIFLSGKCLDNGVIRMGIYNKGSGNMKDSAQYRVFIDAQLAFKRNFKLVKNDSLILKIPANGRTIRLEADEPKNHPSKESTNLSIENCGSSPNTLPSRGFVTKLPQDDTQPEVAIQCLPITDSRDPNDKQVLPTGTTTEHFTPTDAELQYQIRFHNTGTDTAYTATVIDTLSDNLDVATLQIGAASHKYLFNVSGKGKPVLTWTMNNINLPDSTKDRLNSNGFVSFSIKAKTGLPTQTKIENYADIIFDYNDPVRTNTTFNTIYDVPPVVVNAVKLDEKAITPLPVITSFSPLKAKVGETITVKGKNFEKNLAENILKISTVQAIVESANDSILVFKVPAGALSGKINLKTNYGLASSSTDFIVLYPPLIASFSPQKGIPGDKIIITGSNFDEIAANNTVKFGDLAAQVISANSNTLEVKVPSGFYQAKVAVNTPVGSTVSTTDFTMLLTPTENLPENNLAIYPNPSDGKIMIDFGSQPVKVLEISVLNSIGSPVLLKKVQKVIQKEEVDLSDKPAGIYLLLLKTETGLLSRKVVIR